MTTKNTINQTRHRVKTIRSNGIKTQEGESIKNTHTHATYKEDPQWKTKQKQNPETKAKEI